MCDFNPDILAAYHDGELADVERQRVETHLAGCSACAAELAQLREVSRLFAERRIEPMTDVELHRLHDAIDSSVERPALRLFAAISAIAASLIIVSCAWLAELPQRDGTAEASSSTVVAAPEAWERVATTLQPDPIDHGDGSTAAMADASLADWMLHGISSRPN